MIEHSVQSVPDQSVIINKGVFKLSVLPVVTIISTLIHGLSKTIVTSGMAPENVANDEISEKLKLMSDSCALAQSLIRVKFRNLALYEWLFVDHKRQADLHDSYSRVCN